MKRNFQKLGRKTTKVIYWITTGLLLLVCIASGISYSQNACDCALWVCAAAIMLWIICTFGYITISWGWYIADLMEEYKRDDNILSGGLAILAIFSIPLIISVILSEVEGMIELKELFKGISSLVIAAMPAFIGLLGVQYSVATQERNRKEDLRLGAKPFLKIECRKIRAIRGDNKHVCHDMKIAVRMNNIANNIGILEKVISCESSGYEVLFPYVSLPQGAVYEEEINIHSDTPYGVPVTLSVIYKDVYGNLYKAVVEFVPHEKYELSQTRIIEDTLI